MPRFVKEKQSGVALVVVLLFMVAITGIAIWSARQSILSEGMSRNQIDQEVARQAAESALRDAERDIMNPSSAILSNASCSRGTGEMSPNDFTPACDKGLCFKDDTAYGVTNWGSAAANNKSVAEPWWPANKGGAWNDNFDSKPSRVPVTTAHCADFTGGVPLGTYTGVPAITGVAVQPEYLIEVFRRKHVRMNMGETQVSSTGQNANQWTTMYRITARGFGYSQRTQVVLQTVFFP